MSLRELYHNKWARFVFWGLLYILWVIWLGNYWWLFGLVPIFDYQVTKKVKWLFWKKDYKEGEKRSALLEWIDSIIFAVVVVTFINTFFFQAFKIPSSSMESSLYTGDHLFVSKLAYGPKLPQTPLTIPFTHNVIGRKESYSTLIQNDYRRLRGFGNVQTGDYVVFGFPHGDTVLTKFPADDYYTVKRTIGRKAAIQNYGPLKVRPSDKKDHYVKRCVAVAGDTLQIIDGRVYIDSKPQVVWPGVQNTYTVITSGQKLNPKALDKLGINASELYFDATLPGYPAMPLTAEMLEEVKGMQTVRSIDENIDSFPPHYPDSYLTILPFSPDYM
jgi:signal peptidase I